MFVEDLAAPELGPDDRHHLLRVLRLRPGEAVSVADGRGGWVPCTFGADGTLEPAGEVVVVPAPEPALTVALGVPKGDRPEWAVQKLTELGVDHIVVLSTDRGVVRWEGERGAKHLARLGEVARAAARQSRRLRIPSVTGPVALRAQPDLALAEPGGASPSLDHPAVAVGPEGGWSPAELEGRPTVSLGPNVLRSETAAVVAGTLLAALRSGLVRGRA